jgi:MFS family permease
MEKEVLQNKISGIFIASQGLGEALGPVLGSVFEELVGFRSSQDIVALVLLGFMILYFIFCGRKTILDKIPLVKDHLNPLLEAAKKVEEREQQDKQDDKDENIYLPP